MSTLSDERILAEVQKLNAETSKLLSESRKLTVESEKMGREKVFYPFVVGAGFTAAVAAFTKLFL